MSEAQVVEAAAGAKEPDFAAFVAIDWGDREHVWSMQVAGSGDPSRGQLPHTPEAIAGWATELAKRFESRPVAVALEQSRGGLLHALSVYGHWGRVRK